MSRFVVLYTANTDMPDLDRTRAVAAHREYVRDASRRGTVISAGILDDGEESVAIIDCATKKLAERFASDDPAVRAGVLLARVRLLEPN